MIYQTQYYEYTYVVPSPYLLQDTSGGILYIAIHSELIDLMISSIVPIQSLCNTM